MSLTLTHLNADTSWLIIFNDLKILVDPWLFGSQSDYFGYFSTQYHVETPAIQNSKDHFDIIIISHEFTDHCHEETLRSLSRTIPVFATSNAWKRIRRWNYFEDVIEIPVLNNGPEYFTLNELSKKHSHLSILNQISIGYIPEKGFLSLPSLHGATCISFLLNNEKWRSLLYIPHGCKVNFIREWLDKQSNVGISVLLHGFDEVSNPRWLGGILNYGYIQGAQIAIDVKARYWISTHDEKKIAYGLVSKFLKRNNSTIETAQIEINKYRNSNNPEEIIPKIENISNGDSILIDLTI